MDDRRSNKGKGSECEDWADWGESNLWQTQLHTHTLQVGNKTVLFKYDYKIEVRKWFFFF